MTNAIYCTSCQQMTDPTFPHSCFDAALHVRVKDAERAVIDAAKETREFYRANLGERGHPFPLSDLFGAVEVLRTLEGAR